MLPGYPPLGHHTCPAAGEHPSDSANFVLIRISSSSRPHGMLQLALQLYAVARAGGLLPLLLPVSNRCLAARQWAAILALLPVRIPHDLASVSTTALCLLHTAQLTCS